MHCRDYPRPAISQARYTMPKHQVPSCPATDLGILSLRVAEHILLLVREVLGRGGDVRVAAADGAGSWGRRQRTPRSDTADTRDTVTQAHRRGGTAIDGVMVCGENGPITTHAAGRAAQSDSETHLICNGPPTGSEIEG